MTVSIIKKMNLILDSPVYKKICFFLTEQSQDQEENEQINETPDNDITQYVKNVVNPPTDEESEKIQKINSLVQQTNIEQPEEEEDETDETDEIDEFIYLKQIKIYEKIMNIKMRLLQNENSFESIDSYNNLIYNIDHILDHLYTFQYETQLGLLNIINNEVQKLK